MCGCACSCAPTTFIRETKGELFSCVRAFGGNFTIPSFTCIAPLRRLAVITSNILTVYSAYFTPSSFHSAFLFLLSYVGVRVLSPQMRLLLCLPLCGLACAYVGLSLSYRRQKTRYVVSTQTETVKRARCFNQDVADYAAHPDDGPSQARDSVSFLLHSVKSVGDDCAEEPRIVSVPLTFFDTNGMWKLEIVYDLYAHLVVLPSGTPLDAALKETLRNALHAVLTHRLAAVCAADTAALSSEETSTTMAVASLALSLSDPVPIDSHLFHRARRQFSQDGSNAASAVVFVRSLLRSCGWKALAASGVVLLFQSSVLEFLSPAYQVAVATLCLSELVRGQAALPAGGVPFSEYVASSLASSSLSSAGQVLAAAMLLDAVRTVTTTVRDAVGNLVLHQHNDHLREAAVLAVARMDYVSDAEWPVPQRVFGALSSVTNYTFRSVDMLVGSVLERVDLCMTCAAHPLEAAVLYAVQQVLVRAENLVCAYENLSNFMRNKLKSPPPTAPSQPRRRSDPVATRKPQYGLTLWLQLAAARPGASACAHRVLWEVAGATRFPHLTEADRALSAATLATVLSQLRQTPRSAGIQRWLQRKQALLSTTTISTTTEPELAITQRRLLSEMHPQEALNGVNLHIVRHHGLTAALMALSAMPGLSTSATTNAPWWRSPETIRAMADRVVRSCDALPVLAMVLVAQTPQSSALSSDTAAGLERLLQTVDSSSQPYFFEAVSPFAYDLQSLQCAYWTRSDYTQSMRYLTQVITTPPSIDKDVRHDNSEHRTCVPPDAFPSYPWALTFEHVWFRYPGSTDWALRDVSFTLPAGAFLGVVGYSGAGKTSLLLLIARVYNPTRGRILLSGCPIECFPVRAMRRCLAHSWQASKNLRFLEECSVESNVALGHLRVADSHTIRGALERAHALGFVESRARGLKNRLDPSTLSGGEVERLSLARTFMKDTHQAGLYLLDECTSALDSSTEEAVLRPLLGASAAGTTMIMVTHRLSSIRKADLILVLDSGRVAEQGSWTSLVDSQADGTTLFGTLLASQSA